MTASTENAYMPLLQLATLFPNLIALFHIIENVNLESLKPTDVTKYWGSIITIISIVSSLISMGMAMTETYFSKPGRKIYKTKGRWILFFMSIIFQVIPKIFAYQIFAFGFIPYLFPEIGADLIIPTLLILPFVLSFIRAMVYLCSIAEKRMGHKSLRESLFFGLATIYVCSEHAFSPAYIKLNARDGLANGIPENDVELQNLNEEATSEENIEGS